GPGDPDAGQLPAVHPGIPGRIRHCQERLRRIALRLVQRPQHLLPGVGPPGHCAGNRLQPLPADRRRAVPLRDYSRCPRSPCRLAERLRPPRPRGPGHRRGPFRLGQGAGPAARATRRAAMSQTRPRGDPVNTDDLRQALESLLSRPGERPRRIAELRRQSSDYKSTFALQELDVVLDDGTTLELVFKDFGWHGMMREGPDAKPDFLYNPMREIETYRHILPAQGTITANCYGAVVDPPRGRYWLFLERVPGLRITFVGEFAVWEAVARLLANLHRCFAENPDLPRLAQAAQLLTYDGPYFAQWMA